MRSIRLTPMTAETLIICVAVYVGCLSQHFSNRQPFAEVQRAWYAILDLDVSEVHDGVRRAKERELHGPLDIWNGEWWRIPVTVFHHADLLSLVLSVGATWYLGSRLERRWGSFAFAVFLVPAICLPVMAELCLGQACMGLSGLTCAMLGALVVRRQYDSDTANDFSDEAAQVGMAIVIAGWFATLSGIVSLPNAAHLAGFVYGASIAGIFNGPLRSLVFLRVSIILMHLWLVPAMFLVCHPFWIGQFFWYQSATTKNLHRAERSLERAIQCDASLTGAWLQWSHLAEERGDHSEAWRRLIKGLSLNPASAPLIDSTRKLWRHLDLRERRQAEESLEEVFGRQNAGDWLNQIRTGLTVASEDPVEDVTFERPPDNAGQLSLDQKVDLPAIDNLLEHANPQNRKIQIDQNDAIEGETL